jgi:thiamine pyrophosphokinase
LVAVDAALALFAELEQRPTLLLGDFDSVAPEVLTRFGDCERVAFDTDKDKTDGELALRHLLERGHDQIDIYGAIDSEFESDQMLGNIFCLQIAGEFADVEVRLVDHRQHIYLLESQKLTLAGRPNDLLSILPLSDEVELTTIGLKWELQRARVPFGSTWPLRNVFVESEVAITIVGRAIIVHRYA